MKDTPELFKWQVEIRKKNKDVKFEMIFTGEKQEVYEVVSGCNALVNGEIIDTYIF